MNKLDVDRINVAVPYWVTSGDNGDLMFHTEYGVEYTVSFEEDNNPYYKAYWFNLTNVNQAKSPGDKKIPQTVICIIEEFFRQNPDILLYICSTAKGQQSQRARLFLRWFRGYEQQQRYEIRAIDVKGEDDGVDYVALIVQRNHPHREEILHLFDEEISMFNENK